VTETSVSEASESELALQRVVPRSLRVASQRHVFSVDNLEASFLITKEHSDEFICTNIMQSSGFITHLDGLQDLLDGFNIRQTVALHDAHLDVVVFLVVGVVFVGHHPLNVSEASTRLEHSEQLFVDNNLLRGVFNGLKGETSIEAVVFGGNVVEVTLVIICTN